MRPYCLVVSLCIFLLLLILAVFWQVTHYDFVYIDDPVYVTKNLEVQAGFTRQSILWAFTTTYAEFWHPLTWLSHMLDCQLYGLRAGMHHLTNVIFHIANTLLLFLVFVRMTGALWKSAMLASLFALHPLHVESVAWIAERKDVLSTFFWLLTMWCYAGYAERPRAGRYALVLLFLALGLMSKPMLITLPFVLLLMDYWPLGRFQFGRSEGSSLRQSYLAFRLVLEKIPLFVISAASSVVTFLAQQNRGALSSLDAFPLNQRVSNALISYVMYMAKMIWPYDLAVFYPFPGSLSSWHVIAACLLLISISGLVIWNMKRLPYLVVGWLWYLGTLVPVIGLVKFGAHAMADRFTYVPLTGIFIMISWGVPGLVSRWRHRQKGLSAIATAMISVLMATAWVQTRYWTNDITLFAHAIDVTANNYVAHTNLGIALKNRGNTSEAIRHYRKVLKINPRYAQGYNNLGNALASQGKVDEAVSLFYKALQLDPNFMKAHNNIGNALLALDRAEEAIYHFSEALRLNSDYPEVHYNLGAALIRLHKINEAIYHFREALRIRPDFVQAHSALRIALEAQGKTEEAYKGTLR